MIMTCGANWRSNVLAARACLRSMATKGDDPLYPNYENWGFQRLALGASCIGCPQFQLRSRRGDAHLRTQREQAMITTEQLNEAREIVYASMTPTLQTPWPLLKEHTGVEVWVKHENHTPDRRVQGTRRSGTNVEAAKGGTDKRYHQRYNVAIMARACHLRRASMIYR